MMETRLNFIFIVQNYAERHLAQSGTLKAKDMQQFFYKRYNLFVKYYKRDLTL
jgi:hypothetical protein